METCECFCYNCFQINSQALVKVMPTTSYYTFTPLEFYKFAQDSLCKECGAYGTHIVLRRF